MEITPKSSQAPSSGRSFYTTRLLLKKQLWIWPLIAAALLMIVAYAMRLAVDHSLKENIANQLKTVLDADVAALELWMREQEAFAQIAADDQRIAGPAERLIEIADNEGVSAPALAAASERKELEAALAPWYEKQHYTGYVVADRKQRIVASRHDELIGRKPPDDYNTFLPRALAGETLVSRPYASTIMLVDDKGRTRTNVPTMFVATPLRNAQRDIIGVFGFRIDPELDFTRILNVAQAGTTGETYAFDQRGVLLSKSRFDDDLKRYGLLPDRDDIHSTLNLVLRDPGVDMTKGERPTVRPSEWPLTELAAHATKGETGFNTEGYGDYRGMPSFGAWKWLDKYGIGVGTEVDSAEAERPGMIVTWAFWGLFALLAASSAAIFAFTLLVSRLQQKARRATLAAKKLGQYTLEEKIGAGGMGVVYRGRHAMLRRPTAIKLLDLDKTTDDAIKRFEREVGLTSQLNHPNTIAIYDYGRTPDGIFYYAMEYLDGLDLQKLVHSFGAQPEGRMINILLQLCGSLGEAHGLGLIHRDIKPANIFLTKRGGLPDFVKLLDFGLVKAMETPENQRVTLTNSLTGTPLYMSPEAIQAPETLDARSDLYALGAVGYFLLTGTPPFRGRSIVDICNLQVTATPERPALRLGKPVSADFEALLLKCLEKKPADRPATADVLAGLLHACPTFGNWNEAMANEWWAHRPDLAATLAADAANTQSTIPVADDHTEVWTGKSDS